MRWWWSVCLVFVVSCASIPEKAEKHFEKGKKAFLAKRYEQAKEEFQKALKEYPAYEEVHYYLGETYRKEGKFSQAERHFRQFLKARPRSIPALLSLAFCVRKQGRFHEALGLYERVLQVAKEEEVRLSKKEKFQLEFGLALCFLGLQQPEKALEHLSRCMALEPKNPWVYYYCGVAREQQGGMFDRAILEYKQALAVDPRFALAHRALGYLYFVYYRDVKDWKKKALAHYRNFIRISNRKDPEVLSKIQELEGKKVAKRAETFLRCPLCGRKYPKGKRRVCFFDGIPLKEVKE